MTPRGPGRAVRLSHLTFTGADDSVDPGELARLSAEAPLIEWGILLSAEDEGRPRFPSKAWHAAFLRAAPRVRCAAHVCGETLLAMVAAQGLSGPYQRMQLNFDRRTLPPAVLQSLLDASRRRDTATATASPVRWPPVWITQHHEANASLHERFAGCHAVLFDASDGNGLSPVEWPQALQTVPCGYAGGLGAHNIEVQLPRIAAAAAGSAGAVWIDMESALRSGNAGERFDLERVRGVVEIVRAFADRGALDPDATLHVPAGSHLSA
ncbi:MAG TPA: hypothetical protein VIO33_17555 [Burkholderiaceae bacterium]